MQIQCDTREHAQEWERIKSQFDKLGVKYFRSKLFVGDYMSLDNPRLVIDRKKDLEELCGNITAQHERFRNELVRAQEQGIKVVILCEHGKGIKCLEDIYFWTNPRKQSYKWIMKDGHPCRVSSSRKPVQGVQLYRSLRTISERYNVDFYFCEKKETGKRIVELLGAGDGKQH